MRFGQAIGRWGNFVNCEAYGTKTNLPWRMGIYETGEYIEVHPTFLYESLANFAIFIILMFMSKNRKYKGQITLTYLAMYSFVRMIIEGLRTDSLMLGSIRVSQALSLVIFLVSIRINNYKKIQKRQIRIRFLRINCTLSVFREFGKTKRQKTAKTC